MVGARSVQRPPTPAAEVEPVSQGTTAERGEPEAAEGDAAVEAPTVSPKAPAGGEPAAEDQSYLGPTVALPQNALARAEAALAAGGPPGINWFAGQPEGQDEAPTDRKPEPSTP